MKLYLLRHATAQDSAVRDSARELTAEGRTESRVAGQALAKLGAKPARVLTSPLIRARQTAEIVADALRSAGKVEILAELENGHSTAQLLRALRRHSQSEELLLVGHMPDLSGHLAALIKAHHPAGLALGKGSVACVELEALRSGAGELRWLMRQAQLRQLLAD